MFSKQERTQLQELSVKLYGTSSYWSKFLDQVRIPIETVEVPSAQKYVQISRGKDDNRPGTVYTQEVAEQLGLANPGKDQPVTRTISRQPTFEELRQQLSNLLDYVRFAHMEREVACHVLAYQFVNGQKYNFPGPSLTKTEREGYETDLTELVNAVPELYRQQVLDLLNKNDPNGHEIDAIEFVSDVVFCTNHKTEADDILNLAVSGADNEIEKRRTASLSSLKLKGLVVSDSAKLKKMSPKKAAAKKSARKMAKASRKANRK
jgi:hypothetical protein